MSLYIYLLISSFIIKTLSINCVIANITFCNGLVPYLVADTLDQYHADNSSKISYNNDLSIWMSSSGVSCDNQELGVTMCNDCLAYRRNYWCALNFPRCVSSINYDVGICQYVCTQSNRRCKTTLNCDGLPTSVCSPANTRYNYNWILSICLIILSTIFLIYI